MPELLVAWVVFPVVQLLLWLGCGCLASRVASGEVPRSLLTPLGFCVVVVAGGFTTAVPGLAPMTTPLVVALAAAGFLLAPPWRSGRPSPWLAAALAGVFCVYAAPIVLSGTATLAGYIRLDDTATWLALTDQLMEAGRSIDDLAPSSYEATLFFNLADGYPVGAFIPLGVGHTLIPMDTAWLVQPYMALVAVLLATALWDLSGGALKSSRARAFVVFLGTQPALLFGYYLWGGLKELAAAALIALVACLVFRAARPGTSFSLLVPAALSVAALVGSLSVAGAVWVGPLLLGALAAGAIAATPREAAMRAAVLVSLVAALIAPVLAGGAMFPPTSSPLDDPDARGNLIEPLSVLQALGIWPAGDFRLDADAMEVTIALCVLAGGTALVALAVAARARSWDLLGYLVGVPAAAIAIWLVGSPWVDGKALATVSPVMLFGALLGSVWAGSERRLAVGLCAAALLALGVIWSNALAYDEVNLAPREQLAELEAVGGMLEGEGPVLMTEYQPYGVRHFLREAEPEGASELRRRVVPLADGSTLAKGLWADTDDFRLDALEPYDALVLRRSPEQSRPPGEYELDWSGEFYELWVRADGAMTAVERLPLGRGRSPVSKADCDEVRALARAVPGGTLWAASSGDATFFEGVSGEEEVEKGTYAVWLEGSIRGTADLSVDGEDIASVGHFLNNNGLYTHLADVELAAGKHAISVELGGGGLAPGGGGAEEHGDLAISAGGEPEARLISVPASDAAKLCGRRWDWIEAHSAGD
jgi:hypothetical protein